MKKLKCPDFIKYKDAMEAILCIIVFVVIVVALIYEGIRVRNGDSEENYCEMVVKVYYTPTNVKTITFREKRSIYLKSRKGTNIISGPIPEFRTTAPIEVVSYTEERATKNERKRNGKWY